MNGLALILQSTPMLEHLTLYNQPGHFPLGLQQPFSAMTTTKLRTLKLQNCFLHLSQMEALFHTHTETLNTIHFENIALLGGNYVDFFTSLREKLQSPPKDVWIKGWLIEAESEEDCYYCEEEIVDEVYYAKMELRRRAKRAIEAIVRGERD